MTQENRYLEENTYGLRLKLQNIMTGRAKEIEAVKIQFDTVLQGHSALTVIAGDIGIGKTALVKTALTDLSKLNATCVYGKFEQYKDQEPYIAIVQIIESITNHILTLPEERLGRISKELVKELRKDGALITDIVPQTERIIGKQSKTRVNDYQKLKIRLETAFQTFITIAAKQLYPLIIAVDDLQWADKPSRDIIKSIINTLNEREIYIILAYRNNLEEYRIGIKSMIGELPGNKSILEINLESLSYQAIQAMLIDIFDGPVENVDKLVLLIRRKTMGNPLYIKQMINLLLDNKGISYNSKKGIWSLEFEKVKTYILPSDIEDIINRKISSLNNQTNEFMETLACIGSRFSMELLRKINKDKDALMEEKLKELSHAGLIVEIFENSGEGRTNEFEFSHDRIYQNIYEQINPDRREQLHFDIAMKLLSQSDRIYIEENILSITSHLLYCKHVIKSEGAGDKLVADLYFAGIKANQAAAVEHAQKLLSLAEELLGDSCWQQDYGSTLKIKLELAQSEFLSGLYHASRLHFEEMLTHAKSKEDLAEIKKQFMILNSFTVDHAKVIDLGIQALQHLGFKINTRHLKVEIARELLYGMLLFRDSRLKSLENAPIITDKRIVNIIEILLIMAASANLTDKNLFILIVLKTTNLSAIYGISQSSPQVFAGYSFILGSVLGNFKKSEKLRNISLRLAEFFDDDTVGSSTYFIIGTLVAHWTSPAKESLTYLQKSFDCGIRSGDYLFCGYSIRTRIKMKYSMGMSLDELEKFLKLHKNYGQKMNYDLLKHSINIFKDHISMLASADFSPADRLIKDKEIEKLDKHDVMIYYLLKIQRMYLDGEIEGAYNLAQELIKQLDFLKGYIYQVDVLFYFLLVSLERMKYQEGSKNLQHKKVPRKYRKKLQKWAKLSPENHRGKHLLIEALFKSLKNRNHDAASLYDEAIEHAKENNNLLLEALGNYLAADFYRSNRKIAKVYAQDAHSLFYKWGAVKTANWIGKLYDVDDFVVSKVSTAVEMPENTDQKMDISFEEKLKDHQKELEELELKTSFKYFLDIICKEAKADFGVIFLEKEDQIKLEYVWRDGSEDAGYPAGIDPEQVEHLPIKVIRYVSRTYEEVIIDAKPTEGPFAGDDYIRSREGISIICLPLKYNDIFAGLIYLESQNNYQFNSMLVDYIKHLSFYLIAKQALEKESENDNQTIVNNVLKEQLTEREIEVLDYMAEGMSNKEIGEKLYISSSTVKTHTLNLYRKLVVSNRLQAVSKGKALKLVK